MRRNPCVDHGHPTLKRPVTDIEFECDLRALGAQRCVTHYMFKGIHAGGARARRYAQVRFASHGVIAEFDPAILWLPRAHRLGLIAHEIGHALLGPGPHTEDQADAAAAAKFPLGRIVYDRRWPGKGLQKWVRV